MSSKAFESYKQEIANLQRKTAGQAKHAPNENFAKTLKSENFEFHDVDYDFFAEGVEKEEEESDTYGGDIFSREGYVSGAGHNLSRTRAPRVENTLVPSRALDKENMRGEYGVRGLGDYREIMKGFAREGKGREEGEERENEDKECTFRPVISKGSRDIIDRYEVLPLHQRVNEVIKTKQQNLNKARAALESTQPRTISRPPSTRREGSRSRSTLSAAYDSGMKWLEERKHRLTQMQSEVIKDEVRESTFQPNINKREGAVGNFEDRQKDYEKDREGRVKDLDSKVYGRYSFKPELSEKRKNIVERKRLLQSIKNLTQTLTAPEPTPDPIAPENPPLPPHNDDLLFSKKVIFDSYPGFGEEGSGRRGGGGSEVKSRENSSGGRGKGRNEQVYYRRCGHNMTELPLQSTAILPLNVDNPQRVIRSIRYESYITDKEVRERSRSGGSPASGRRLKKKKSLTKSKSKSKLKKQSSTSKSKARKPSRPTTPLTRSGIPIRKSPLPSTTPTKKSTKVINSRSTSRKPLQTDADRYGNKTRMLF